MVSLERLCSPWPGLRLEGRRDIEVAAVTADSRRCGAGSVFVATRGSAADGHVYVPQAVAAGCAAIVVASDRRDSLALEVDGGRPPAVLTVPDTRGWAARLGRELAGRPDEELLVAGVTGTNGKTTVAFLLRSILTELAGASGLLGTVRYDAGGGPQAAGLTTPDGPTLYGLLRRMRENGQRAVAMEISSHALDQERTADLALDVAVLTNLSRDHLDYHRDMESYVAAKLRILDLLRAAPRRRKRPGTAVINGADPAFAGVVPEGLRVLRFAATGEAGADVRVLASRLSTGGTELVLEHDGERHMLSSPLVGRFNVENLTAAYTAGIALGLEPGRTVAALARVDRVDGRLERFALPGGGTAVVDYAHTPAALDAVLRTCRELSTGRLLVVFGAGGDRDRGKRPLMGGVAAREADCTWLTSDNPRREEPEAIIEEIRRGFAAEPHPRSGELRVVLDRAEAIAGALGEAAAGDIVVIAGKGHEDYQIIGERRTHLDDRELVRDWIAGGGSGRE
jgi:UDP-N-acetylmuramoyl-L-alanyl-D-glutamate--2,6-diaminopimelate ligase